MGPKWQNGLNSALFVLHVGMGSGSPSREILAEIPVTETKNSLVVCFYSLQYCKLVTDSVSIVGVDYHSICDHLAF
jgi:hypothetical protein